jgi:hypothetical protein
MNSAKEFVGVSGLAGIGRGEAVEGALGVYQFPVWRKVSDGGEDDQRVR